MFEKRVLRRIFRPKRDDVTGEWRKLHIEELNDPYCSSNNILVIKSRKMRWEGHVACMGTGEERTGFWWGDLTERDHLEDLCVDGKMILKLKLVSKKCDADEWTGMIWIRMGRCGWSF